MKILALIPARKGSIRLKNKNMVLVKKKPLIYHTIKAALESKLKKKNIYLYSDGDHIINYGSKFLGNNAIKRPANVSKKNSSMYSTIKSFLKDKKEYDYLLLLQPTSPLRTFSDINKSIEILEKNKNADGVLSTYQVRNKKNIIFNKLMIEKNNFLTQAKKIDLNKNKIYIRNGPAILLIKIKCIKKELYKCKLLNYKMPEKKSVDINTLKDLKKL